MICVIHISSCLIDLFILYFPYKQQNMFLFICRTYYEPLSTPHGWLDDASAEKASHGPSSLVIALSPSPICPPRMGKFEGVHQLSSILLQIGVGKSGPRRHAPFSDKQPVTGPVGDLLANLAYSIGHQPVGIFSFKAPDEVLVPINPDV